MLFQVILKAQGQNHGLTLEPSQVQELVGALHNMSRRLEELEGAAEYLQVYVKEFGIELLEAYVADQETEESSEVDGVDASEEGDLEESVPEILPE